MKKVFGIAALVFLLSGCASNFTLNSESANLALFSYRDFTLPMENSSEPKSIIEIDNPVFNASDDCTFDRDLARLIASDAELLASRDNHSTDNLLYVNQDILEFKSVEFAKEFMDLVRAGHESPGCKYSNETASSTFSTRFQSIETVEDVFELKSDDSILWVSDLEFSSDFIDVKFDMERVYTRKGRYILALSGSVSDESDFSLRDIENEFGKVIEQFLTGRPKS